jgi:Squalene-hopene cyclase C-terminal domain
MKTKQALMLTAAAVGILSLVASTFSVKQSRTASYVSRIPKGCVFRTVMGEEKSDSFFIYKTNDRVHTSIDRGLDWVARAQQNNGGWGSGSHARQDVRDPHAVSSDPATTAMVSMALLRTGNTLSKGTYASHLKKSTEYLLRAVESSEPNSSNITTQTGTQIQTKLGTNIDVILTSQYLTNLLDHIGNDVAMKARVKKCIEICVTKIQNAQSSNGSMEGSGWAGVLQSSFATNALEAAEAKGAKVDNEALGRAREFQKKNYDAKSGNVNTDMGAGVVLYSVSGSTRASAKEARRVQEEMDKAKSEGRIAKNATPSASNLEKIGFAKDEAIKYATAYEVYNSAKIQSQSEEVISGFGNNGGEEFMSFLQTGESMIISKDNDWTRWYDNTSGRLLQIQNNDGSWNGHHCITSPAFCTATCLLILSVNNDVERLVKQGGK